MRDSDKRIGTNLQVLRGDVSQAALANAMKNRGWKWSQPTVAAVEKGERPLKLAEAEDLVEVLGLREMEDLVIRPLDTIAANGLERMQRADRALRDAVLEFWHAQFELSQIADEIDAAGHDLLGERREWARWLNRDPATIVREESPVVPMRPEVVSALAGWEDQHPWSFALAAGQYGEYSKSEVLDAAAADATQ